VRAAMMQAAASPASVSRTRYPPCPRCRARAGQTRCFPTCSIALPVPPTPCCGVPLLQCSKPREGRSDGWASTRRPTCRGPDDRAPPTPRKRPCLLPSARSNARPPPPLPRRRRGRAPRWGAARTRTYAHPRFRGPAAPHHSAQSSKPSSTSPPRRRSPLPRESGRGRRCSSVFPPSVPVAAPPPAGYLV